MTVAPSVTLAEAIPLVAALAARIADDAGIRLLLIKGQPATDLGVRADRPSVDVDVWVEQECFDRYVGQLHAHGWRHLKSVPAGIGWDHAVTLAHQRWPITIDVHHTFPGFMVNSVRAFAAMWSSRTAALVAGTQVPVPDIASAAVISYLHAQRSQGSAEAQRDLVTVMCRVTDLDDIERRTLRKLARDTDTVVTVAGLLQRAGLPVEARPPSKAAKRFQARAAAEGRTSARWLVALRQAPLRRRPSILMAALRPSTIDYVNFRAKNQGRRVTWAQVALFRWRRGIQGLWLLSSERRAC